MTDESNAYTTAGTRFASHKKVDHSREEYAYRDRKTGLLVTTNAAESYFALFKRSIYGTFHNISEAHLDAISRSSISGRTRGNCLTASVAPPY